MQKIASAILQQVDKAVSLYEPVAEDLSEEEKAIFERLKKCHRVLTMKPKSKTVPLTTLITTIFLIAV